MKRKLLKLFMVYSYITLVCYVGSESALETAKYLSIRKKGTAKGTLKFEWLWATTFKRIKEFYRIMLQI